MQIFRSLFVWHDNPLSYINTSFHPSCV